MRKSLTLTRVRSDGADISDEERKYLLSCLVHINIEKSKDDLYTTYTKYWEELFKDLDIDNIAALIKCDFNHVDPTVKDKIKKILREKKWRKTK